MSSAFTNLVASLSESAFAAASSSVSTSSSSSSSAIDLSASSNSSTESSGFGKLLEKMMSEDSSTKQTQSDSTTDQTEASDCTEVTDESTEEDDERKQEARDTFFMDDQSLEDQEALSRIAALGQTGILSRESLEEATGEDWQQLKDFVLAGAEGVFDEVEFSEEDCAGEEVTLEMMQALMEAFPDQSFAELSDDALQAMAEVEPLVSEWPEQTLQMLDALAEQVSQTETADLVQTDFVQPIELPETADLSETEDTIQTVDPESLMPELESDSETLRPGEGFVRLMQQEAELDVDENMLKNAATDNIAPEVVSEMTPEMSQAMDDAFADDLAADLVQDMAELQQAATAEKTDTNTALAQLLASIGEDGQVDADEASALAEQLAADLDADTEVTGKTVADLFADAGIELDDEATEILSKIPAEQLESMQADQAGQDSEDTSDLLNNLMRNSNVQPQEEAEGDDFEMEFDKSVTEVAEETADASEGADTDTEALGDDLAAGVGDLLSDSDAYLPSDSSDVSVTELKSNEQTTVRDVKEAIPMRSAQMAENIEKIEQAVRQSVRNNLSEMSIQLSPPELGKISIHLEMQSGSLSATIKTETNDAQQYLSQNIEQLRHNLEVQGIDLDKFDVNVDVGDSGHNDQQDSSQTGTRSRRQAGSGDGAIDTVTETAATEAVSTQYSAGGVNIVA